MIKLKSESEAERMRRAGKIAAAARALAGRLAVPGETTRKIDRAVHDFILSEGAAPTFLGYNGFPASICASVNEQVIHGIPNDRKLAEGDLLRIDVGATKDGCVGDCAAPFLVGGGSEADRTLIDVTRDSFYQGIKFAREGYRVSDISRAIQDFVERHGFSVVRDYVGHGVGSAMHEEPEVPNYVTEPRRGPDPRLLRGMTLAIEPMVNAGGFAVKVRNDGWTVVTRDGSNSAHYENSILITPGEPEILTVCGDI